MTNNCNAGKLSIMKCDKCRDGYLIVKVGNHNEYFLGCTNYKKDGTGCDNIMSKKKYYEINNFNSTDEEKLEIKNTENREGSRGEECARNSKVKPGTNDLLISEHQIKKAKLDKNVSYKNIDLNEVVYITLSCLANISTRKYYGVNILIDVLRGAKSQKIVSGKLDKVYEYGKLKNINRDELYIVIDWLIKNHFILKTNHPLYPVLHLTHEGLHYDKYITSGRLIKLLDELNSI